MTTSNIKSVDQLEKGDILVSTNHGFEIKITWIGKKKTDYLNLETGEKVSSFTTKFNFMLREGVFLLKTEEVELVVEEVKIVAIEEDVKVEVELVNEIKEETIEITNEIEILGIPVDLVDIKNTFDDKEHPHTNWTIREFMCGYENSFDSLNLDEIELFKTELTEELQLLIDENRRVTESLNYEMG